MDISIDHITDLKKTCNFFLNKESFDKNLHSKIVDFQKNARIKGFRPGKIKIDYVKKKYGESLKQEMISELVDKAWKKAIDEHKFELVHQPDLNIEGLKDDGFYAQVSFEVAPVIDILEPSAMEFEAYDYTIDEKNIEKIIDDLSVQYAETAAKEGLSEEGDVILANIAKKILDEQKESETEELKDQNIVLLKEKTLPIIVEKLVGVEKDAVVEFEYTYDDTWHDKTLAGKTVHFSFTVLEVQSMEKASLETIGKNFNEGDQAVTEEETLSQIKAFADQQAQMKAFNLNKEQTLDFLMKKHQIQLPEVLLKQIEDSSGQDLDPQALEKNKEDRKDSLKIGFILDNYMKKWNVQVTQEAMQKELLKASSQFGLSPEQFLPLISQNKKFIDDIRHEALINTFIEELLSKVSFDKVTLSYTDLMEK